jgi:hypothetical protein
MTMDFGKSGKQASYDHFTQHPIENVIDGLVLEVLNFESQQMGTVISEVLILAEGVSRGQDLSS